MPTINLAERRPQKEPYVITDGNGNSFTLAPFISAAASLQFMKLADARDHPTEASDAYRGALADVFGPDHVELVLRTFTLDELQGIIAEAYQVTPGESQASADS